MTIHSIHRKLETGRDSRLQPHGVKWPRSSSTTATTIMTKHSKNNTASSIFSYAERKKLDYGTKGVRPPAALISPCFNGHDFCSNASAMSPCEDLMRAPCVCSGHATR